MKRWLVGFLLLGALSLAAKELYVASGTFYYWFHGMEYTAGFGLWGGPDPLWCFKFDLFQHLPDDFDQRVWKRMWRRAFLGKTASWEAFSRRRVSEAVGTAMFGRARQSITWKRLYITASDPKFAADVANAYMDELAAFERERLGELERERTWFKVMAPAKVPTNAVDTATSNWLDGVEREWRRMQ